MKYVEIIEANKRLQEQFQGDPYGIRLLSNIEVFQLKEILEYTLRREGINASVSAGNFDNIVQDSAACGDCKAVVVFWEACSLVDGFYYRAGTLSETELAALISKTMDEIDIVVRQLENCPLVLINRFSSAYFHCQAAADTNLDRAVRELNAHLEERRTGNTHLVGVDRLACHIGIEDAVNFRNFSLFKTLYSFAYLEAYSEFVLPFFTSAVGQQKKALILDCDNTLWRGVLGEDGPGNILMASRDKEGAIFEQLQCLFLELKKNGAILGLCSKNNVGDVDDVIRTHPDMTLRDADFAIKKIDWTDKVSNLMAIADELNIGLDSMVFVDDSAFERDSVRSRIPQIRVFGVPGNLAAYLEFARDLRACFYSPHRSAEDLKKTELYVEEGLRTKERAQFGSLTDYLASLHLKVTVHWDDGTLVERMSQMSLKTNQFNLTTRRYSVTEIEGFLKADDTLTAAIDVKDEFGDYGVTGLSIILLKEDVAVIDTFLLSCRIIGRTIEEAFLDGVLRALQERGVREVRASYHRTPKNGQVAEFYDRMGFCLLDSSADTRSYSLDLADRACEGVSYVEVTG